MGFELKDALAQSQIVKEIDRLAVATKDRPAIAPPTTDPDRHTTYVPTDHTTLSLGQKFNQEDDKHIQDFGITGRTDRHVHFHVAKDNKTIVSLGGPATSVQIDSHDPKVPKESIGYSMVTDDDAWHDAKGQHYLVSRTKDVVARAAGEAAAATALVQSDKGVVTLAAGQTVAIGGQGAVRLLGHTAAPIEAEPKYDTKVERKVETDVNDRFQQAGQASAGFLKELHDLLKDKVQNQKKAGKWKEPAWEDVGAAEVDDVLGKLKALYEALQNLLKPETTGSIDLVAEKQVSAHADQIALHGASGASVSSAATAQVSGDTAALAGKTNAVVWSGTHSSLKSGTDVSIEAEAGKVTLQAKEDVQLLSETKGVLVQGNTDVQLNAKDGSAFVHGTTAAYVGAGGGAGYGVSATANDVQLGKMGSANSFGGPSPAADEGIKVEANALTATVKGTSLKMEPNALTIATTTVEITGDGEARLDGARILIG